MMGCLSDDGNKEQLISEEITNSVSQEIIKAEALSDYRLYVTMGRRSVIPGFPNKNFASLKSNCGVKLLSGSGDVLKSREQQKKRMLKYQFAVEYNLRMYDICLQKTS